MANPSQSFLQIRSQIYGEKNTPQLTPVSGSGPKPIDSFLQERAKIYSQPQKKIVAQPVQKTGSKPQDKNLISKVQNTFKKPEIKSPIPDKQIIKTKEKTIQEKIFSTFSQLVNTGKKEVDLFKREAGIVKEGFKTVVPRLEQAGGVVLSTIARNAEENAKKYGNDKANMNPLLKPDSKLGKDLRNVQADTGKKLIDKSNKSFVQAEKEKLAKFGKKTGVQGFIEDLLYSSPSTVTSVGTGLVAGLVTKNPQLGVAIGLGDTFTQGVSDVYREAKNNNMSEKDAQNVGVVGGLAYGVLNKLPIGRILEKTPEGEVVKKAFIKKVADLMASNGKQAVLEGMAEGGEQFVTNVLSQMYMENKDLFKGVPESFLAGSVMGGVTDVAFRGGDLATNTYKGVDKSLDTAVTNVETAVNTPSDKRTPEQELIVQSLLQKEVSPSEALALVVGSPMENTPLGKDIVKLSIQATGEGKSLLFKTDEQGGETHISVIEPGYTVELPQNSQQESKSVNTDNQIRTVAKEKNIDVPETFRSDAERNAYKQLTENSDKMVSELITKFNGTLNGDDASTLFEGYNKTNVVDYSKAAGNLVKLAFRKELDLHQTDQNKDIIFTAGGPGSGKSSAVGALKQHKAFAFEYDSNLINEKRAKQYIGEATGKGYNVTLAFVDRNPVEAWTDGVIKRFREGDPRTVPIKTHVTNHIEARKTIAKLYDEYKDNPNVDFAFYANTKDGQSETSIDSVRLQEYNREELTHELTNYTTKQYEAGSLTKAQYEALTGRKEEVNTPSPERRDTKEKTTSKVVASKETPVGTGRTKNSRLFERVKETLGAELENQKRTYNELSLNEQANKVATLIEENPEKATRIAKGFEEPPAGVTQNAVSVGLAELARAKGDFTTAADLWTKTSLRSTRLGQEIVSLRGDFSGNESLNAVKQVLDTRIDRVIKRYSDVIKGLAVSEDAPTTKKVDALVTHQAKRLKKELTQQQRRIQSAQSIINALTCK